MHHLAFDCHKSHHAWALLDEHGTPVRSDKVCNSLRALQQLRASLPSDLIVGFEGPAAVRIIAQHCFADRPCFEISPHWTHSRRRHSPLPDKDDPSDALRAAQALWTYHAHLVPLTLDDDTLDALRQATSFYRRLARRHGAVKNRIHHCLTQLWQDVYLQVFRDSLGATARNFFHHYPHPHAAHRARQLPDKLRRWSKGHFGQQKSDHIKQLTQLAPPPTRAEQFRIDELRHALEEYDHLQLQRQHLKTQLTKLLLELDCSWLMELSGLGPVRAAELVAGGLLSSPGPDSFARRSGIAPVKDSSGNQQRYVNAELRHEALFDTLISWATAMLSPKLASPLSRAHYQRKIAEGKSRRTALRCVARQLIRLLFKARHQHRASLATNDTPTHLAAASSRPQNGT